MKLTRRFVTLSTLFMVAMLVLVACGGTDPTATPVPEPTATSAPTAEPMTEEQPNIVDIAVADGRFTTLVAAVEAAGLVDTLAGEGPYTVFAPTDDAFAAVGTDTINALLADPETLSQILLYHVVPGRVMAADVVELDAATTAQGEDVTVTVEGDSVMINDAQVVITDIEAANGVIHVIDTVLMPPSMQEEEPANIVETAAAAGQFETLLAAAEAAGLADTLRNEGPFTVFAPTDDAFAALGEDTLNSLLADPETLSQILLYHVVSGEVYAEDVVGLDAANTVQGEDVTITVDGDTVMVNDATVIATDIQASNGVIHVIDTVLLPPSMSEGAESEAEGNIVETAQAAGQFQTLLAAAEAAGLVDELQGDGPFTVFAPTDEAFAALGEDTINSLLADPETLSNILLYHVVSGEVYAADVVELNAAETATGYPVAITRDGENVMINDATVVTADIQASNGVIHVIDTVLLPPSGDIVQTAQAAGQFETLLAAADAAGLVDALKGEGPLTVFAPTDDAFATLGEDTINALLEDPDTLSQILLYHVVDGNVFSGDAAALDAAPTLQDEEIIITVDEDGNLFVNDAQVIVANIIATNGVIHVIDAVMTPPSASS